MGDLFGWDLIYKVSENCINKKEDNLVLLVHFLLIKNGFKCLGLGDDKGNEEEKGSELLPRGWSESECYAIRYRCEDQAFVLRSVPVDNSMVFNLLETKSLAVSNVALVAEAEVKQLRGEMSDIFSNVKELMKKITGGLITPVKERSKDNCEATTQTPQTSRHPDPRPHPESVPDLVSPHRSGSGLLVDTIRDPLRIGGTDLDPLGGLGGFNDGGGMLFDPFHNPGPDTSGLPRGSIPPGARFDPFAPPGAGGPRRPNRGPPDFNSMDPFGGSGGRRPFGGGGPPMFM